MSAVVVPKSQLGTFNDMIQEPYTLADLPPSLTGSGSIQIADVHSLAGASKKKRSELAVAIDYECVNLYDVLKTMT